MNMPPLQDLQKFANEEFDRHWPDSPKDQHCLVWAAAGLLAWEKHFASEFGRLVIQAGSASWRFRDDDTNKDMMFGYDTENLVQNVATGRPLEWHVWLGHPEEQVVIDLSSRYQVDQLERILGVEWQDEYRLPEPLMATVEDCMVRDWRYHAEPFATSVAFAGLTDVMKSSHAS